MDSVPTSLQLSGLNVIVQTDIDPLKQIVISCYDSSLKFCFISSVVTAVIGLVLIVGIRLPSIRSRPAAQDTTRDDQYQKVVDQC